MEEDAEILPRSKSFYVLISLVIVLIIIGISGFIYTSKHKMAPSTANVETNYKDSVNKISFTHPATMGNVVNLAEPESPLGILPYPKSDTYRFSQTASIVPSNTNYTNLTAHYIKSQDFSHLITTDSANASYSSLMKIYTDTSDLMAKIFSQRSLSGVDLGAHKYAPWFGYRASAEYIPTYFSSDSGQWRGLSYFMYDTDGVNATNDVSYSILLTNSSGDFFSLSAGLYGTKQKEIDMYNATHPYTSGTTIPEQDDMTVFMHNAPTAFASEVIEVNKIASSLTSN